MGGSMTQKQIDEARQWLIANRAQITRIRPRLRGSIVSYIPRRGWGPGFEGFIDGAPGMFSTIDGPDPLDAMFRELGIPVDQPL